MNGFLKFLFLISLIFFNSIPTSYAISTQTEPKIAPLGAFCENSDIYKLTYDKNTKQYICLLDSISATIKDGKPTCAGQYSFLIKDEFGKDICITRQFEELQTGQLDVGTKGFTPSVNIPCVPVAGGECPQATEGIAQYIARIYQFSLMVVGLLALAGLIFGAVKYILSAGNIVNQEDARDQIKASIIGLLILLGAYLILRTINPALVTLRNPTILKVERVQDTTGGTPAKQSNLPSK